MKDTLEIHAKFEGEPARIIELMIEKGRASNRTEAIRLAILDYNNHHPILEKKESISKKEDEEERTGWSSLNKESLKRVWDNPKDDEVWNKY
jgi:hypothetical protein